MISFEAYYLWTKEIDVFNIFNVQIILNNILDLSVCVNNINATLLKEYIAYTKKMKTTQFKTPSVEQNRNSKSSTGKMTPLDLDIFIPWFCAQFQIPIIVIRKCKHEDLLPNSSKRTSSTRTNSKMRLESSEVVKSSQSSLFGNVSMQNMGKQIPLTTYYNPKGQLVELAFINCPIEINRKVIKVINLCLPFHTSLNSLKIKRGGLTHAVLYEISKLLPHSNITEVCLEDNYLPEGNYYLLLEKLNSIRNLSLRRCHINDEVCKSIVKMLNFGYPASKTLLTLDLASNNINDVGAECVGMMLRNNRTLLYLNISDNKITDVGASYLLNHMLLFPLSKDEIIEKNYHLLKYFIERLEVYNRCKDEILRRLKEEEDKENQRYIKRLAKIQRGPDIQKIKKIIGHFDDASISQRAEQMTTKIVGEFKYVFADKSVVRKNGQSYAIGNLKITYLNIAYNNLGYISVRKLYDVLKYQNEIIKPDGCKGLLKIVLEGNNIPESCDELNAIDLFLKKAIQNNVPEANKSGLKKKKEKIPN